MAATKRRKAPPQRAKRSLLASRPTLPRVALEPHHIDIIGLALIALGIFLAGVAYFGLAGGALGNGLATALRFVLGAIGYVVPVALLVGGGLVLARELRPPTRPLRAGSMCLTTSLTLALAAGTLGLGPGRLGPPEFWRARAFESRGGVVGEAELWVASHLLSTLGAHILAVFLFVAGLILVTGATLAGVLRVTGTHVVRTSQALRRSTEELALARARRPMTAAAQAAAAPEPLLAPEPADTTELVVRATHVEAPAIEEEPEPPEPEGVGGNREIVTVSSKALADEDLTPQGRYRG
ncbi:MAG: hypothetical protein JO240_08340, partial [Solirubrobacterales bacterium]|nr:hypothetical protein [Solirubrobacterales bacterium]